MKDAKRVFLYAKGSESGDGKTLWAKAVSEDGQNTFEYVVNQENYEKSLDDMLSAFEKFCIEDCGFDDMYYCDIWTLDDEKLDVNIDWRNGFRWKLDCKNWGDLKSIEHQYNNRNSHIENPVSFEEFKAINGYDESKELFETKRIYDIYKREIDKNEFAEREIATMAEFLEKEGYAVLFEAMGRKYPLRFKLRNTLSNLYVADKQEYEKQIDGLCGALIRRINTMIRRFADILGELPEKYNKSYNIVIEI